MPIAPHVAGLIQLFCLTTCLWTFGRYLERVLHVPTLSVVAVYLVSGIMGGLASANLAVDRITVTSSAAVCGLLGMSDSCAITSNCTCGCHNLGLHSCCSCNAPARGGAALALIFTCEMRMTLQLHS